MSDNHCQAKKENQLLVPVWQILLGCDSFASTDYDIRIINDKSTTVVLTAKNVLDEIGL